MTFTYLLQLIGAVSGIIFSVSGLMLVNGLNFLNNTKNGINSYYRELSFMLLNDKINPDELIHQLASYDKGLEGESWVSLHGHVMESNKKLGKIRDIVWSKWKSVALVTSFSTLIAGIGLLMFNDDVLGFFTLISGMSLIFGVVELYYLIDSVYTISTLTIP
jgi:hypothetical protein